MKAQRVLSYEWHSGRGVAKFRRASAAESSKNRWSAATRAEAAESRNGVQRHLRKFGTSWARALARARKGCAAAAQGSDAERAKDSLKTCGAQTASRSLGGPRSSSGVPPQAIWQSEP